MTSSMSSPISRVSILKFSVTTAFRSRTLGVSICLRLKASNWRVSAVARFGGVGDFLCGATYGRIGADALQQELAVAGDDHQQIIEVVRNAAGEAADSFHFLGLTELLLERAMFGHILGKQFEERGVVFVTNGSSGKAHSDRSGVLTNPIAINP